MSFSGGLFKRAGRRDDIQPFQIMEELLFIESQIVGLDC